MVCWNAPVLTHSNSGGKLEEIRLVCAKLPMHSLQFVLRFHLEAWATSSSSIPFLLHPLLDSGALPSAKPLPRAALDKESPVKNPSAKNSLPSAFYRALGKVFAECSLGTRQRKVTVTEPVALSHALPSATSEVLGKDFLIFFFKISLPSALPGRHSAKIFF